MKVLKSIWEFIKRVFSENHRIADNIFTLIILFISITSFFHVVQYWMLTNKAPFFYITAVATELIILGSMMAIKYTKISWIPFILGTLIQGIGNVFYSFINIDVNAVDFQQFTELFKPVFQLSYGDDLEVINYKRVLASFNGLFYLTPIVFLWAKMSLQKHVKALKLKTTSEVVQELSESQGENVEQSVSSEVSENSGDVVQNEQVNTEIQYSIFPDGDPNIQIDPHSNGITIEELPGESYGIDVEKETNKYAKEQISLEPKSEPLVDSTENNSWIDKLIDDNQQLEQKVQENVNQVNQLEQQHNEILLNAENLKDKVSELEGANIQLTNLEEALRHEVSESENKIEQLENQVDGLDGEKKN